MDNNSDIHQGLKYTKNHTWVSIEDDDTIKIGLTDYAQQLLGDVIFIELPAVDMEFHASDECALIESVKTAANIYSPISGKVVSVNSALVNRPQLINEDAYGKGWIFALDPDNKAEILQLLSPEEYEEELAEKH